MQESPMTVHWLDRVYGALRRPSGCFSRGWGDEALLRESDGATWARGDSPPLDVTWSGDSVLGRWRLRQGTFTSPEHRLPPEVRQGRLQWLLPARGTPRSVCVMPASWGDEGYGMRNLLLWPLVAEGFSFILVENAFYGRRRRRGVRRAPLESVADLALLGLAACEEMRSLLERLRQEGHTRLAVAGYSMAGQLSLMVASGVHWPLAAVALAPSASPAHVLTRGILAREVCWDQGWPGASAEVLGAVFAALERASVLTMPPPHPQSRVVLVGTRQDGVVSPEDILALARHIPQAEVRWLPTGHLGAYFFHQRALRAALRDGLSEGPRVTAPSGP